MKEETAARHEREDIWVREVAGIKKQLYQQLLDRPRVYEARQKESKRGDGVHGITPGATFVAQSIHMNIRTLPPGGLKGAEGRGHFHMNGAVMYLLEGEGYEIHDRERFDWKAGDAFIVRNGCVHQHNNASPDKRARILIMKGKPPFTLFNLLMAGSPPGVAPVRKKSNQRRQQNGLRRI